MSNTQLLLPALLFSFYLLPAQETPPEKKLIEIGWDSPKLSFLVANIREMENQPFDGVVFRFDEGIYNAFDTFRHPDSHFHFDELKKIKWKRFTDNFLSIWASSPVGPRWQDDKSWKVVTQNLEKISLAVKVSGSKGICFDPEYYYENPDLNPWIYKASLYNNLTYTEVGVIVRKRGNQFMKALQKHKPDIKILSLWLLGLVIAQHKAEPIEQTGMALLPFFIEGLLEAKNSTSEIIDGNETSYWYSWPADFILAGEQLREDGSKLITPALREKYRSVSLAQSIYLDGLYATNPAAERGLDMSTKERWLTDNLYHTYKTSDKYIWFYTEKSNWWEDKVDPGVKKIINDTRKKIKLEQKTGNYFASGKSRVFDVTVKLPEQKNAFDYVYDAANNSLVIKNIEAAVKSITVFQDSRPIHVVKTMAKTVNISLKGKYSKKGSLIIIGENRGGKTFVSYVN